MICAICFICCIARGFTPAITWVGVAAIAPSDFTRTTPPQIISPPTALDDLVTLAGVGRKTANVVRSVAFGLPGLPVDTHVGRLSRRWGLTVADDPVKVEAQLCALLPPAEWGSFSLRTILHGRRVCDAKKPRCAECVLEDLCPASLVPRHRPRRSSSTA